MTLPPEKIGDKGQRFVVEATNFPKPSEDEPGWQACGYSDTMPGAERMRDAFKEHPSPTKLRIRDRNREA